MIFSYTVFDTGTLDEFNGAVNRWLLQRVCFSVFRGAGACRAARAIYKQFCFSHLGLCCWFQGESTGSVIDIGTLFLILLIIVMVLGTMSENFRSLRLKFSPLHAFEVHASSSY